MRGKEQRALVKQVRQVHCHSCNAPDFFVKGMALNVQSAVLKKGHSFTVLQDGFKIQASVTWMLGRPSLLAVSGSGISCSCSQKLLIVIKRQQRS